MGPDEDDVLAAGEEVEREDSFEDGAFECGRPVPVPIGEGLKRPSRAPGETALDASALPVFELCGDEVFEQYDGAPALAGGRRRCGR